MVKCSKCGNEIPSQSKYCLSCGTPVSGARREVPTQAAPKKSIGLWAVMAALVILAAVALLFAFSKGKVTQVRPVQNAPQAPVVNPPPVPSTPQPGVLQTDVEKPPLNLEKQKTEPPADVVAYLEHLKRVEKARQDTSAKELNDLVAKAPDIIAKAFPFDEDFEAPQSGKELSGQASQFSKEWQQIASYFLSVQPPQACALLAGKYYDSLREFVSVMGSFQDAVGKTDLAKLKQIKRTQASVDQKLTAADQELGNVCRRFGIEKTFSVQADTGQTPLLGF